MSSFERAVAEVVEALKGLGYEVTLRRGEHVELTVAKGGVSACVTLIGERGGLGKLSVRPGCGSGLSVIDCGNVERVKECVDRLLRILETWSGAER
jgi:hypothetical protein